MYPTTFPLLNDFLIVNFPLYVATFQQHMHVGYKSLSWSDIPELVVPIRISLIGDCWANEEATEPRVPIG